MDHIPFETHYPPLQNQADATKEARKMYEGEKDYLLSQIFHVVSNYSSMEAEIKRLARAFEEHFDAEINKDLCLSLHEKGEAENRFIHLMEEKNAIEKQLNQSKAELNDLKLMYSRMRTDYVKTYDEMKHWYEAVVGYRQELEHWYESMVALLNNFSIIEYDSCDHTLEGLYQERINCLVEEKAELETRLSSLILESNSIRRCPFESLTALEEERKKLTCQCNEHKECIEKLKLAYEQEIHKKCALQADLDFLKKDLATREENEGRISSEVVELKTRNEDLVQKLKTITEAKEENDQCCFALVALMCLLFIAKVMGLAVGKGIFITAFFSVIFAFECLRTRRSRNEAGLAGV